MKNSTILPVLFCFLVAACSNHKEQDDKTVPAEIMQQPPADSIKPAVQHAVEPYEGPGNFDIDEFPITNEMLLAEYSRNKNGELLPPDQVWFANDSLQQLIVIDLATDFHRFHTYYCSYTDIPDEMVEQIGLYRKSDHELASFKAKKEYIPVLIDSAKRIAANYFISAKGLTIGDSKEKVLEIYGKPQQVKKHGATEIYTWEADGDEMYTGLKAPSGKKIARNSFGLTAKLFFAAGKLTGWIITNDIP